MAEIEWYPNSSGVRGTKNHFPASSALTKFAVVSSLSSHTVTVLRGSALPRITGVRVMMKSEGAVTPSNEDTNALEPSDSAGHGVRTLPVQVPGLAGVIAVAAGERHALALCGQLGNGTSHVMPAPVKTLLPPVK
jgi:hypothetical protein